MEMVRAKWFRVDENPSCLWPVLCTLPKEIDGTVLQVFLIAHVGINWFRFSEGGSGLVQMINRRLF